METFLKKRQNLPTHLKTFMEGKGIHVLKSYYKWVTPSPT